MRGMCIESASLLKECQLTSDQNLCIPNLDSLACMSLREIMTEYRTKNQYALSMSSNLKEFKQLSEVETILNLAQGQGSKSDEFQTIQERFQREFRVRSSGQFNAVLYWYELVDKDSEFFLQIDDESTMPNDECNRTIYSPYNNYNNSNNSDNISNQFAAVCFYDEANCVELDAHKEIKVNFSFKNDLFHANCFKIV